MASQTGRGVAARLWCEPETEHLTMIPELAEMVAGKVDGYHDLIETAWGIIANSGGGNWENENPEWVRAAVKWRQRYHSMLASDLLGQPALRKGD